MNKEKFNNLLRTAETVVLDDEARKKEEGSFISLPSGNTHYEMKGEGEAVVMVHGYATPYYIYDKIFNKLISLGYKVIRYDLLGRGMSERVDRVYNPDLFVAQLDQLTKALLGDEKFYLFGTSMGGTIVTSFCAAYPEKVKKLILLAPAGMDNFKPPFYMQLVKIPVLGGMIFNMIGSKSLLNGCAKEMIHHPEEIDYYMEEFAKSLKYKGFVKCTKSSLLNTILATKKDTEGYIKAAKTGVPMLCIWGTLDKTMPYYQQPRLKEIWPDGEFVTFDGSGHIFLFDEGDRTLEKVIPFLQK